MRGRKVSPGFSGCGRFFVRPGFSVFFRCLLSSVYCLLSSFVWGWFCGAVFWLCGVFFCFFGVRGGCLPADVSEVLFSCIYNFCEFCSFCELFRQLLIGFSLYGLKFIIAEQKGVLSAIMRRWSGTFFRAWKNAGVISWCRMILQGNVVDFHFKIYFACALENKQNLCLKKSMWTLWQNPFTYSPFFEK